MSGRLPALYMSGHKEITYDIWHGPPADISIKPSRDPTSPWSHLAVAPY